MFGMRPTRPATWYGYIRAGAAIGPGVFTIERFVEKPDAETAASYVAENYLWNSGNFMFRAHFLIEEYRRFEPDSAAAVTAAVDTAASDLEFEILDPEARPHQCQHLSHDDQRAARDRRRAPQRSRSTMR